MEMEKYENLMCAFCNTHAQTATNSPEGDEYYPVCNFHKTQLVEKFGAVECELITEYPKCECGCDY